MTKSEKTFTADGYSAGSIDVGRNYNEYREKALTSIATHDGTGRLTSNLALSLKDTKDLIKLLQAIVDENEALKPKPLLGEVAKLTTGTIFTMKWDDEDHPTKYVRTKRGADELSQYGGSWELKNFITPSSLVGTVTVVFDPTK